MNGDQLKTARRSGGASGAKRSYARIEVMALALSVALAGLTSALLPMHALAQTPASQQQFSLPAGNLREALDALAIQGGITVLYSPDLVAGKTTRGLSGRYSAADALSRLLQGADLEAQNAGDATYTLRKKASRPKDLKQPARGDQESAAGEPQPKELEAITVTGTRIRGGTTASPVITIGVDEIREEGFTNLGEVIRSIPQNFAGGQNPGVSGGAVAGGIGNQDITGGSSLNLRGLGSDATLTLLNGRRLVYDGFGQAIDISAIPIEAVERIEIMPDGASAIYGSDAVAGVANVVLKRDFEGLALGVRYGTATRGGLDTWEYTATGGATWATGGFIATAKSSSADPIFSNERDFTENMHSPSTIYPGADLKSGLLSAYQRLGDVAELRLDALRTDRDGTKYMGYDGYYYHYPKESSLTLISPSIVFNLPRDWSLTAGGTRGKNESFDNQNYVEGSDRSFSSYCYCNRSSSYELGAEGPVFNISSREARAAVGVGSRTDEYAAYLTNAPREEGEERVRYAYAELNLPLIAAESGMPLVRRLELSAAVRSEDYDSFGRVTTPKVGLIYDPSADFTFKLSWGKSFKAPQLSQRYLERITYLFGAADLGGSGYPNDATVLLAYGGNAALEAERATTKSASIAFHPETITNLDMELTWFDVDYTDRVVQPIGNILQALSDPIYADYINHSPTIEQQEAILEQYPSFYNNFGGDYVPGKVVAIINDEYVNAARQRVKGVDLSGNYRIGIETSQLTLRGAFSWLETTQQTGELQDPFRLTGRIFYPAKRSGRVGAVWNRAGFGASAFLNYKSGVTSRLASGLAEKTASFTTVDATLNYDTGKESGAFSGVLLSLSAQNLLDRDPPFYTVTSLSNPPYDSTNYSAIGRYLSFSITKFW